MLELFDKNMHGLRMILSVNILDNILRRHIRKIYPTFVVTCTCKLLSLHVNIRKTCERNRRKKLAGTTS